MIEVKQRGFSSGRLIMTAAVLSYGFWGYGPSLSAIFNVRSEPKAALHSFFFTLLLVVSMYFTIQILNNQNQVKYVLTKDKTIFIASAVGLMSNALLFPALLISNFTGDELSYLQNSFNYAQKLSAEIARNIPWLRSTPYFITLATISLLIALTTYLLIYKVLQNQRKLNAPLIIGSILILRLCNDHFFQFGSAYPNLYGTFLQSFSYLSVFPFVVRSIQWIFISYLLITTYAKYWRGTKNGTYLFAIICLPLMGLSSSWTAIEPSIFFVVCAFLVLSILIKKPERYIEQAVVIVTICTFMRATSIILLPLIIMFSVSEYRKNKNVTRAYFPLAILVPYIVETGYENLTSQLKGIRYSDVSIYSDSQSPILSLIESIRFQFEPVALLGAIFLLVFLLAKSQTRFLTCGYLLIAFPIYALMIPNATRGLNKYAIEIVIPLILISLSSILEQSLRSSQKLITTAVFIGSICANLVQASSVTGIDTKVDNWRQVPLVVNYPVENYSAYRYIRTLAITQRCYNPGTTYGVFPFTLSNYSISQIDALSRVFNENVAIFKWGSDSVDISKIKADCLVVDNFPIKQDLAKKLKASKWELIYSSEVNRIGTQVAIWRRGSLIGSEEPANP